MTFHASTGQYTTYGYIDRQCAKPVFYITHATAKLSTFSEISQYIYNTLYNIS